MSGNTWSGLPGCHDRCRAGMSSGAEKTRRLESRRGRLKACSTIAVALSCLLAAHAQTYDILIAGGRIIDPTSQARRGIFESPAAENQIRQGVTTVIEGPDGGSPLPLKPFLDKLAATRFNVNFGLLVGQGSIRQQVIGLKDRKATADEIASMKELTRQAMLDGAFGLSTGLFYLPGAFTPTEEGV